MAKKAFFRKIRIGDTGTATIICTDAPLVTTDVTVAGLKLQARTQAQVTFGVLSLIDPATGLTLDAKHPMIKQLQAKLKAGDELTGFQFSANPVVDRDTREETGLYWIEPV